jgi:hypothetical protein
MCVGKKAFPVGSVCQVLPLNPRQFMVGSERQLLLSVCSGPERGMNRKYPLYMLGDFQTIVLSLCPGFTP